MVSKWVSFGNRAVMQLNTMYEQLKRTLKNLNNNNNNSLIRKYVVIKYIGAVKLKVVSRSSLLCYLPCPNLILVVLFRTSLIDLLSQFLRFVYIIMR